MDLMKTIARALGSGANDDAGIPDEPGAQASTTATLTTEEKPMSTQSAPGSEANAGITEADYKAAVTKAETDGKAAGRTEANDRMAAILGADGIKGDGGRMAAALDLANQSPGMAAEAVIAFVTANVPENKPAAATNKAAGYEQQRLAAAGLTQPNGNAAGDKPGGKSGLSAAVDRRIDNLKRTA